MPSSAAAILDSTQDPRKRAKQNPWHLEAKRLSNDFELYDFLNPDPDHLGHALAQVSFHTAGDAIRRNLKSYIGTPRNMFYGGIATEKLFVVTVSPEMDAAIAASRRILAIEIDPAEGITVKYTEETLKRASDLLREMAELFWQVAGELLPVPSIGPAHEGSIDLFWEAKDLTLLINIPSDQSKDATFFGRRLATSKISGTLDKKDIEPRHLTGWLSGRG